jgi:uncharacterized membrane protein required for colicin V production
LDFNFIDIILFILLALFSFKSYRKGFTGEVFGLLAIILSFIISIKLNPMAVPYVLDYIKDKTIASIVVFGVMFVILNILIRKIGTSLRKFMEAVHLGWLDSLAGACVGMIKAFAIAAVFLFVIKLVAFAGFDKALKKSKLAPHIEKISYSVYQKLKKGFPKELGKKIKQTTRISRNFFSN